MRTGRSTERGLAGRLARGLLCLVAALTAVSGARADDEAVAYGIDEFSASGACIPGEPEYDLSYSVAFAEAFDDAFDGWVGRGKWGTSLLYRDTAVDDRDWTDSGKQPSWGADDNDPYGADHADVAMISTHGTCSTSGNYSSLTMGDGDNYDCSIRSDDDMRFGDGGSGNDLDIVVLAACLTAQFEVWDAHGYDEVQVSGGSLNTWLGFHGLSFDSSTDLNHIESFVNNSRRNGLGDNWVDKMSRNTIHTDDGVFDECATAVIWASSESKCDDVYNDGGFSDRNNDGSSHSETCFYFIEGCNPEDGTALHE